MSKNKNRQAVLVDFRMPEDMRLSISRLGADVLLSCRCEMAAKPLCGHPDLQICFPYPDCAVCAPELFSYYQPLLSPYGIAVKPGIAVLDRNYPADIAYNVARAGRCAMHLLTQTDPVLLRELEHSGIALVPVRQGYAKCNICVVDECSIITSDAGLAAAARKNGMAVLQIVPGHIALPGYPYGFIGGASGSLPDGTVVFCGDVRCHPDFLQIDAFFHERQVPYVSLSSATLTDFGSVLPILTV